MKVSLIRRAVIERFHSTSHVHWGTVTYPYVSFGCDGVAREQRDHLWSSVRQRRESSDLLFALTGAQRLRVHGTNGTTAIVTQDIVSSSRITENVFNLKRQ